MNGDDRTELQILRLEMNSKLNELNYKLDLLVEQKKDHETRIRSVERWKLSVPISVLLAMATIVGALISGR